MSLNLHLPIVSLANFIFRKLEELLVARAKITHNVKANFGLASAVEKEYAGKKVQLIYQKSVMIAGLM